MGSVNLMELTSFNYKDNATINLFSLQGIVKERLNSIELFLKQIREVVPNSIDKIVDNILSQYGETVEYEFLTETEYELLNEYPVLFNKSKSTILSLLNYSKYQNNPIDERIKIDISDVIRSAVVFRYYQINSLLSIMSQEKAVKFFKDFVDHSIQQIRNPKNFIDTVDDSLEGYKTFFKTWQAHNVIVGKLDENTIISKVTRCRWAEIMKEFDPELSYIVTCYGDIEATKNNNPNFILTRPHTLMQGAEYCDFCVTDTHGIKEDIRHPPIEIWDKIC